MERLLEVRDLEVSFRTYGGEVRAVRGVSFDVDCGESVAIVGESACGKTVTAQTLMSLIPIPPGKIGAGSIRFNGVELTALSDRQMEKYRGSEIGMIFQDPMTSLNPLMRIGDQIAEVLTRHQRLSRRQAKMRAVEMLEMVGIPEPAHRGGQYPHEFSGGMRQRVMIALALACRPKLLIADEPTTSLDVTIQAQILELMKDLQNRFGTAIILITHDLGIVANLADRVLVMYAGRIIESGSSDELFYHPAHPYTWGLLKSVPKLDSDKTQRLISVDGTPPDLFAPPAGCAFAVRCEQAMRVCYDRYPGEYGVETGTGDATPHKAACWLAHPEAMPLMAPREVLVK
ncbi:MAG: ABC transporter ATP-binding protein [Clostridia bacterium]|nr:ABC transporter ATP-binding protein [Clostridia bacterium]